MQTRAAVLEKLNCPLRVEQLTLPELKPGQVLVKIAYSGICHSQLNEIRGLKGEDKFLPHTLGHEGSGEVIGTGLGVRKLRNGDHVVLTWIRAKGADVPASEYKTDDGIIVNSGAISTFMEYAIISENRLVKISRKLSLKTAALLGCAIPTGAGAVFNTMEISNSKTIAIFGLGGVGYSALLAAKTKKASMVIAVDLSEGRLKQAVLLGATHTLNAANDNIAREIIKITNGIGVDYAFESAGKKEAMEIAFKSVRDQGGVCVIAGNLGCGQTIQIDPFDLIKGKRIIGTWGGQTQPERDIPRYADWVISGKLDLEKLIAGVFKLESINDAISYVEQQASGRVLIEMGKQ